jgi:hypothetical protein
LKYVANNKDDDQTQYKKQDKRAAVYYTGSQIYIKFHCKNIPVKQHKIAPDSNPKD